MTGLRVRYVVGVCLLIVSVSACGESSIEDPAIRSETSALEHRQVDPKRRISAGIYRTCVIGDDGKPRCFGHGPLGNGTTSSSATPVVVSLSNVVDIALPGLGSSDGRIVALRSDGTVWQWGTSSLLSPSQVSGLPKAAIQVSTANCSTGSTNFNDSACVVLVDGTVWSWGPSRGPTQLAGLTNVIAISGDQTPCALQGTGYVSCWGWNAFGGVGDGTQNNAAWPLTIWSLPGVVAISAGTKHTCALESSGTVSCWGQNLYGQIGNGTSGANVLSPVAVSQLGAPASRIAVGPYVSCAVRADGQLRCWGRGDLGQVGSGDYNDHNLPVFVGGMASATEVAVGYAHACSIESGVTWCWGGDFYGEVGNGQSGGTLTYDAPQAVIGGLATVVRPVVSAATNHTCALRPNGQVKCWGDNFYGQLGNGTHTSSLTPVTVGGLVGVVDLHARDLTSCAVVGGNVYCWGCPLPSVSTVCTQDSSHPSPVEINGISNAVAVRVGGEYACALLATGSIVCWGADAVGAGVLGNGTNLGSSFPVAVSGINDAVALDTASEHACAIRSQGYVYCWGDNFYGQLGNNSNTNASTPVLVPLGDSAVAVTTGNANSCVAGADGLAYCWGNGVPNADGTEGIINHPQVVSGETDVVDVTGGSSTVCLLRAQGGVRCWGTNIHGERGDDGTSGSLYVPSDVVTSGHFFPLPLSAASSLSSGFDTNCATISNGSIYCWGMNPSGQVGNGNTTDQLMAVPVLGL